MPISSYNPDGTVDIYNKKTGEVRKGVKPEELGAISPNLVASYAQGQTPQSQLERTKAEVELGELEKTGKIKTESQKEKEASAQAQLGDMEEIAMALKSLSESGKNVSGRATGKHKERLADVRELLPFDIGGGDFIKNVDETRSLASQLAAEIAFGEGGKTFTETEKALLAGQIPNLDVEEKGFLGIGKKGVSGAVLDTEEELANKMQFILDAIERKKKGGMVTDFPSSRFTIEAVE